MNKLDRCESGREILEIEELLTADERRPISVNDQFEFQRSIQTADLDDDFDDMIEVSWPEANPPSRRSDKELSKLLGILDSLEGGRA